MGRLVLPRGSSLNGQSPTGSWCLCFRLDFGEGASNYGEFVITRAERPEIGQGARLALAGDDLDDSEIWVEQELQLLTATLDVHSH